MSIRTLVEKLVRKSVPKDLRFIGCVEETFLGVDLRVCYSGHLEVPFKQLNAHLAALSLVWKVHKLSEFRSAILHINADQ